VINHPAFPVEPWVVRETELDLERLAQTESVFALSNGHIGLRGNLDEGEPFGLPGTYLAGFHELQPLPYAEAGFGYPESGQVVVNATNGKLIRLLVDDEPFDVRYGTLRSHERVLDLRAGVLRRTVEWLSPAGCAVRVSSTRLVSFSKRAIAAILYEVEPLERQLDIVLQSELVANEALPSTEDDPRAADTVTSPLQSQYFDDRDMRAILVHQTAASGLTIAAAMDHELEASPGATSTTESFADTARLIVAATITPGRPLRLIKYIGYGWSAARSLPAVRDQVGAALADARRTGWDGLLSEQQAYLDEFWDRADVELDGDAELQQALRFALFHVLAAGARAERRAIAAKGLTGPGYNGHAFWDTETFVLPVLTYTTPDAARDALLWRANTLELARARATQLGLPGATFPWRTIDGQECSSYWPAGTAAFHVNADISDAVMRYYQATGDEEFARTGVALLVETARMWRELGHHDVAGRFRIDGVTGPDEYSAIADNNVYTNLMAQRNLRSAADAVEHNPDIAVELSVDGEEAAGWRDAAERMTIPYDPVLGVHPQSEAFTDHGVWDFDGTDPDHYPLLLHYPYFELYRQQVVKQADLVLALHLCGDSFTDAEKARDFDYYERLTVRDSSLSACTQAVVAAEVGHLSLAYDYLSEAALIDLDDLEHNTRDGLHIASLAGTWIGLVAGFGGLRDNGGVLSFKPRLPPGLGRVAFRLCVLGRRLLVEVEHDHASYSLRSGAELAIVHHGASLTIPAEGRLTRPIPAAPVRERPSQPRGREPLRRSTAPEQAAEPSPRPAEG
jgi:alpha,alpha-trehalose phosphorylase